MDHGVNHMGSGLISNPLRDFRREPENIRTGFADVIWIRTSDAMDWAPNAGRDDVSDNAFRLVVDQPKAIDQLNLFCSRLRIDGLEESE